MFNIFWNLNFENSKYVNLDIPHKLALANMEISSDEDELGSFNRTRAAPSRKRFGPNTDEKKRNSETLSKSESIDKSAETMIQEVTGKKFSFGNLFHKKTKKKYDIPAVKDNKKLSEETNVEPENSVKETNAEPENSVKGTNAEPENSVKGTNAKPENSAKKNNEPEKL